MDDPQFRAKLAEWGAGQPLVRAMLLTSTLAIPQGASDALSDYDVILVLLDLQPFHTSRGWLAAFGQVLVMYSDPLRREDGLESAGKVVQFEAGLKMDFTLWPVEKLKQIAAAPKLPDELDAGYQVLLDKDGLTTNLKPPTYRGYIPRPPTEAEYQKLLEEFWLDSTYAAKFLWRDDLMAAKRLLDEAMKQDYLRPMLEWLVELDHNWSVKPGPYGRGLKRRLRPDLWAELEATYAAADLESNWTALDRTLALMRRAASEVAERMGFTYPLELEARVRQHLRWVRQLPVERA